MYQTIHPYILRKKLFKNFEKKIIVTSRKKC